jgi:hypothetical protein
MKPAHAVNRNNSSERATFGPPRSILTFSTYNQLKTYD